MRNFLLRALPLAGVLCLAAVGFAGPAGAAPIRPAATSACGANCTDAWFTNPGSAAILTNHSALTTVNNLVRIVQGSNGAPKGDWSLITTGTVFPLWCNLNGTTVDPTMFSNHQCQMLANAGLLLKPTFQIAFNPDNGGDENLCAGAWNNAAPVSGFKLRLEDCGTNPDTVDIYTSTLPGAGLSVSCPGGTALTGSTPAPVAPATSDCGWLLNGASSNFSAPLVATSSGAFPSDPTWTTLHRNGMQSFDSQEVHLAKGPF